MKILRQEVFFNYKEIADIAGGGEIGKKFVENVRASRDAAAELIRSNRRSIERPAKEVIKRLGELPESVKNNKDISEGVKKLKDSIESSQKQNRRIADRFSRKSIISDYVTAKAKTAPKANLEKHSKKIRNIGLAGTAVGLGLAGAAGYSAYKDHREKKKKREEIWKDGNSKKK